MINFNTVFSYNININKAISKNNNDVVGVITAKTEVEAVMGH